MKEYAGLAVRPRSRSYLGSSDGREMFQRILNSGGGGGLILQGPEVPVCVLDSAGYSWGPGARFPDLLPSLAWLGARVLLGAGMGCKCPGICHVPWVSVPPL